MLITFVSIVKFKSLAQFPKNKTEYRTSYSGLVSSILMWKLKFNIETGVHTKKRDKSHIKSKRLQLQ